MPLAPLRMMDTRDGTGLSRVGKIGPGGVVTTMLGGTGRLPAASEVSAVVLNLSTVHPTAGTFLTVYPADVMRPPTSSINIGSLDSLTNLVTVPLHADGRVSIFNAVGSIDAIIDVVGYYAATDAGAQSAGMQYGGFTGVEPYRKLDTRTTSPATPFGDYYWYKLVFNFTDQAFNNSITAAVVNISAVSATRSGFFTAWDGDSGPDNPPATSSVNFRRGRTSPTSPSSRWATTTLTACRRSWCWPGCPPGPCTASSTSSG